MTQCSSDSSQPSLDARETVAPASRPARQKPSKANSIQQLTAALYFTTPSKFKKQRNVWTGRNTSQLCHANDVVVSGACHRARRGDAKTTTTTMTKTTRSRVVVARDSVSGCSCCCCQSYARRTTKMRTRRKTRMMTRGRSGCCGCRGATLIATSAAACEWVDAICACAGARKGSERGSD
jgi:hypothetical protein